MVYLTKGEKQEIILKLFLIKYPKATIKDAFSELYYYESLKGHILDLKG